MNRLPLPGALAVALAVSLSASCTTVESTSAVGDNSAEQVMSWIEVNRSKLPTDYDEFVRLPWAYRAGVFSAVSPVVRSTLYRTHLERYSLAHPDLTTAQRAVIDRSRELATPDWYALTQDSPDWQARIGAPAAELQREAFAAFDRDEAIRVFAKIGPDDPAD